MLEKFNKMNTESQNIVELKITLKTICDNLRNKNKSENLSKAFANDWPHVCMTGILNARYVE